MHQLPRYSRKPKFSTIPKTVSTMAFNTQQLILASTSKIRGEMLRAAGLDFESIKPDIDEQKQQTEFCQLSPRALATRLACTKALSISKTYNTQFIIGADQTLEFESHIQHKARTASEAISNLRDMCGKSHHLHSAVSVVKNNEILFGHTSTATLVMRPFSEHFLGAYVMQARDALLNSVGGYYFEGAGVQLFESVEGDIHTILGLPLMPLLAFLRREAIIPS